MTQTMRRASQVFFASFVALLTLNHTLAEQGRPLPLIGDASLHALCPLGGVEALFAFLRYDVLVPKIHTSSFVILAIVLFLGVLFGPVFCSYVCPLGSVQEWFGRIGKRLFGRRYNRFIPQRLDRRLRYLRYLSLAFTVYLTTNSLRLVFLEVDPYYALYHFWSDEVTIGGLVVLSLTLLGSLFVERPWCKYACPFGAVLGLTNRIRLFQIRRRQNSCIECGCCDRACPMNVCVSQETTVRDHQCIACHACTSESACPVPDTVVLQAESKGGRP